MAVRSTVLSPPILLTGGGALDQVVTAPADRTLIVKRIELWNGAGATRAVEWRFDIAALVWRKDSLSQLTGMAIDCWWVVYPGWTLEVVSSGATPGLVLVAFGADLQGIPT